MKRPLWLLIFFISLCMVKDAQAFNRRCELAEELYLKGNYRSAAYECEKLFREYKAGQVRSEAAYIAGLSYLRLNNFSKSKRYFLFVLDNSNDPILTNEAQVGLINISKKSPLIKEPSSFSIQMGSFKDKRNADRLYKRFKRRRYTVRITEERDGKVIIYKVKIGRFKSRKDAVKFAKKLRKRGYQTAIVAY